MNSIFSVSLAIIILLCCNKYIDTVKLVVSDDTIPVPSKKSEIENWFNRIVKPYSDRNNSNGRLDSILEKVESNSIRLIRVNCDGTGEFETINDAVNSIPHRNMNRVVIFIGPGIYNEKIKIDRTKPFITFFADPNQKLPELVFNGTAAEYGTVESATLVVEADYYTAVNIVFKNSAPRPDGKRIGAQAVAVKIGGNKASFYNCKFYGFQDTLCDDKGLHFFKDCYIEGTIDFIFGNGKSIYLNTVINVVSGDKTAIVTAQARHNADEDTGFSFLHCKITGTGAASAIAYLGRSWIPFAKVVFSYTDISDVVRPIGWSNNKKSETEKTVFFGEFGKKGAGAKLKSRAGFTHKLTYANAKPYLCLSFIKASTWLLPPPTF